jgi:60 kDa SS-A/Ro ribonucleoprotein
MPDALSAVNLRQTPQTERADPRQVQNSAGGYTFTVTPVERLRRFLVLGTDGGTFYVGERELTKQNADVVLGWARERATELVDEVRAVSIAGRAPRQNPAIFALAAAASLGDLEGRRAALASLRDVCRTGYHLFLFAGYVEQFRGWGRALRRAVADWYAVPDVDHVAYQAVKYRQREGWTHRDLLRLAHPGNVFDPARAALFDWICGRPADGLPGIVDAFAAVQGARTTGEAVAVLKDHPSLPWEALPPELLNDAAVWRQLLGNGLPQTALLRQLPRLTRLKVLRPLGNATASVAEQLTDAELLRKARVHPISVLIAARTYAGGVSLRGDTTWQPVPRIVDALNDAFYAAYAAVEPAGKRTLLCLDVSASMAMGPISGLPITPREASAALALVTMSREPEAACVGFTSGRGYGNGYGSNGYGSALTPLPISPRQRLDDAVRAVSGLPFGGTDCSLPMLWAAEQNIDVDTFVVYSDNEMWAGLMHPHQALRQYRAARVADARLVVVGMTATDFTIADPTDPGSLDVAGFDSAVPALIRDFSAREL